MSADNWGTCPKCNKKYKSEKEKIEELYGKVPVEEYHKMLSKVKVELEVEESTLREDFEVWTDKDGVFHVSYHCECEVCGLDFSYKHEEQIEGK